MASSTFFPIGPNALFPNSHSLPLSHSPNLRPGMQALPLNHQVPSDRPAPHRPKPPPAQHAPRALVFMNFEHPEDSRRPENRKTISRWAMLNRPRPDLPPVAPPNAAPSLPREPSVATVTSTSPPDTTSTWSTVSETSPPGDVFDLPYHTSDQTFDGYFDEHFRDTLNGDFSALQESDFFTAEAGGQFAQLNTVANQAPSRPRRRTTRGGTRMPNGQNSVTASSSREITSLRRNRRSTQPTLNVNIRGAANDPFDCLPVPADAHTHELVYMYLNAQNISPIFAKQGQQVLQRLKSSREAMWWPLTCSSKAALAALIAYVESTPEMKNKARTPSFLQKHLDLAMSAITEALKSSATGADDAICFAIVLLMNTAARLHDNGIFHVHAKMLAEVLEMRANTVGKGSILEDKTAKNALKFTPPDNGVPANRCLYCRDNYQEKDPSRSRETSPEIETVYRIPTEFRGMGFYDLVNRGHLSQSMEYFIAPSLEWNRIAMLAKRDRLSAAAGASHAWVDGSSRSEANTPFDMACMYATRMCLYLSAWLDWNHSCAAVRSMLGAVYDSLQKVDMDMLQIECPDALLWIALMVGPYAEGDARCFFSNLLVKAQHATSLLDFGSALMHVSDQFLWTPTMTPAAERFFWDGMTLPMIA